ncbi:putative DNA helicase [Trypanosoma grayi]|uniref:putative DNA helicase n=1 Tax=Trypanosoma grayi TaxID=71804 RepID=UPI0004F47578|nr:putative DNA helicase [Trypanosoma grayi]KEG09841.1 putative DNA helicase [Trypanosoma grayi]
MNCYCSAPVKCTLTKAGTPAFTCAANKCRFMALTPVQASGYRRIVAQPGETHGVAVVRFEAVLHPETKAMHVTATGPTGMDDALLEVLEEEQYKPSWYVEKKAYLYPMDSYGPLVSALKRLGKTKVDVEEIPSFFFRCVQAAQEIQLQHECNVEGGASQRPDIEDVVYAQLRPFQRKGVDFIISRGGRGMIADDMGLGKTIQALAVAHHYRDEWPVLIVCPLSLVENWAKEFTRFCSIPMGRIAILQTGKLSVTDVHSVVIVPYSSLKCLDGVALTFKVVVLDESHYIKTVDSKRTVATLKICRDATRVLLLSGTPTLSRPIELYPQLQAIMHPSWTPTKSQFGARYCNAFVSRFGVDYTGHSNMSELHVLLQHFAIRRTKVELGNELPSKSRQLLYVYVTPKERKALEKGVAALRKSLKDGGGLSADGNAASAEYSSSPRAGSALDLKSATARAKVAAVQDYVRSIAEQIVESGQKVIFFAHHRCMMEAIRGTVEKVHPAEPLDFIYIVGDTPAAQRDELIRHFQTQARCHVAILSMQACGVGHNLTCATMVVFAELDWNPSTHLQCEDRVHRMGQVSTCVIKYLLAEGTSDSVIWPMLQTKLTVTHAVLEDAAAGGDGWSAGADTRRVARTDVCLTPSSQERRQTTLEAYLSSSGSRSCQTTQNGESGSDARTPVAKNGPAGASRETPGRSQTAAATAAEAEPVLLDIATLRQRRESNRVSTALPPSPRGSGLLPISVDAPDPAAASSSVPVLAVPVGAAQRQATLLQAPTTLNNSSAASQGAARTKTAFRVSVATAAPGVSSTLSSASTRSNGTAPSPRSHTTVKLPFVVRPSSTIGSPTPPSTHPSVAAPVATISTAVTATASSSTAFVGCGEQVRLAPAPRSEELRRYNARRTLFTVGSVGEKRPRSDGGENNAA